MENLTCNWLLKFEDLLTGKFLLYSKRVQISINLSLS